MVIPVLKCDCGEVFSIETNDSIHQKTLKENNFRNNHSKCVQKRKYIYRAMPKI